MNHLACRNITCSNQAVSFVRVQATYADNLEADITDLDIDADWLYCRDHYEKHRASGGDLFEFHDTLEGVRYGDV